MLGRKGGRARGEQRSRLSVEFLEKMLIYEPAMEKIFPLAQPGPEPETHLLCLCLNASESSPPLSQRRASA